MPLKVITNIWKGWMQMDSRVQRFFDGIRGKRVAFCGIGVSNTPLVEKFIEKGALVTACDRRTRDQLGEVADQMEAMGAVLKFGPDYLKELDADILFRTPGMQFHLSELEEMRARGVVVTSEMEVFFDLCPCKLYAVTGSDGKTTTTSVIAEMLRAEGKTVHLGGNIGRALLPLIEDIQPSDCAVVELSSFQLISMRKSPDVAVVTNISPNHLDVHKDMGEYIGAKLNILIHQNAFGRTVLNLDNETTRGFAPLTRGQTLFFSRRSKPATGAYLEDGMLKFTCGGRTEDILPAGEIRIPGLHNVENYLAAITAVWGTVSPDNIRHVARSFSGVEHRAEFVRDLDGVRYYNDSIATSPTRTASGTLSLYADKIILIAGGYDKKIPFDALGPVIVDKVKTLILMGATAGKIEAAVKAADNYAEGSPEILHASSLEEAVGIARGRAVQGDIVSLSPACASFDSYVNFEARGNHFKEIIHGL